MGKTGVSATKSCSARAAWLAAALLTAGCAEPNNPPLPPPKAKGKAAAFDPVAHATQRLAVAREKFKAAQAIDNTAWHLGQACFQRAEFARDNAERARLAQEGIDACQKLIDTQPKNPGGHYYLGMNLGQMARVKRFSALGLVKDMEDAFGSARKLNPQFSHAGPDRNLGLLYFKAPRFISVGDAAKARAHLEAAVKLAPDYPANRLNLLEAFIEWEDTPGINTQRAALKTLLPEARKKFTGNDWAADWLEWNRRWANLGRE